MIDRRVFLTVLVCTGIFFVWQTFIAPPPVKKKPIPASAPVAKQQEPASQAVAAVAAAPASQPAAPEQFIALQNAEMEVELSTYGAALTKATLKEYKEGGKTRGEHKHPVSLVSKVDGDRVDGVTVLLSGRQIVFSSAEKSERGVVFSGNSGGVDAKATWTLGKTDYTLDLTVELKNAGAASVTIAPTIAVAGVFNEKKLKDKSMFEPPPDLVAPVAYVDGKLKKHEHGEKDSPQPNARVAWAGIDRQYFLLAAAPVDTPLLGASFDETPIQKDAALKRVSAMLLTPERALQPGETAALKYTIYAGPKASRFLKAPGRELEEAIDYKVWFMPLGFLSRPMLWVLNQAHAVFHSYGIAILLLTLIVKLLLLPITQKSFVSMQVMRDLKPDLDKIKVRFPDDREKQGLETMRLYKERGVNPFLSGCLPALFQMPIYLALWRTLWAAVELYQQEFLWLGDLTAKDPYYILPLLLGITMFAQQKLSPPMGDPQQQKIMLYMMPPLMTMFMVGLPGGLVFYIFVNTILTILQQAYITRKFGNKKALKPAT